MNCTCKIYANCSQSPFFFLWAQIWGSLCDFPKNQSMASWSLFSSTWTFGFFRRCIHMSFSKCWAPPRIFTVFQRWCICSLAMLSAALLDAAPSGPMHVHELSSPSNPWLDPHPLLVVPLLLEPCSEHRGLRNLVSENSGEEGTDCLSLIIVHCE